MPRGLHNILYAALVLASIFCLQFWLFCFIFKSGHSFKYLMFFFLTIAIGFFMRQTIDYLGDKISISIKKSKLGKKLAVFDNPGYGLIKAVFYERGLILVKNSSELVLFLSDFTVYGNPKRVFIKSDKIFPAEISLTSSFTKTNQIKPIMTL